MITARSQRERAKYAFGCVQEIRERSFASEYKSHVKSFPSMILQNGIGNALAFAYAKSDGDENCGWGAILWQIYGWVENNRQPAHDNFKVKIERFIQQRILNSETAQYRSIEVETLSLLNWLKRFASGMIAKETAERR